MSPEDLDYLEEKFEEITTHLIRGDVDTSEYNMVNNTLEGLLEDLRERSKEHWIVEDLFEETGDENTKTLEGGGGKGTLREGLPTN